MIREIHTNPECLLHGVVAEGCADHFLGRPFDANPYSIEDEANPDLAWLSWRWEWLKGSWFREMRTDEEAHWTEEGAR